MTRKATYLVFAFLLITPFAWAQEAVFVEEMHQVMAMADTSSTYLSVLNAAQNFERLAITYDDWTATYWAAFVYTQAGLHSGDERLVPYVDLAQFYHDKAFAAKPTKSKLERSDFHALQGLIYNFRRRIHQNDADRAAEFAGLVDSEYEKAEALYPDNPRVWAYRGIRLIRSQEMEAGVQALQEALNKHDQFPRTHPTYPDWGRHIVDIWLGRYAPSSN